MGGFQSGLFRVFQSVKLFPVVSCIPPRNATTQTAVPSGIDVPKRTLRLADNRRESPITQVNARRTPCRPSEFPHADQSTSHGLPHRPPRLPKRPSNTTACPTHRSPAPAPSTRFLQTLRTSGEGSLTYRMVTKLLSDKGTVRRRPTPWVPWIQRCRSVKFVWEGFQSRGTVDGEDSGKEGW